MVQPSARPDPRLELAGGFPAASVEQWRQQVEQVLRRSGHLAEDEPAPEAVEDVLASTTYDGITVHPLYTRAEVDPGLPGFPPHVRGSDPAGSVTSGWDVRQRHVQPDPVRANRQILADLNGGVSSIWLRVGERGVPVDQLGEALHEVRLDLAAVVLDPGADFSAAAEAHAALVRERELDPTALRGNFGADPLGVRARTGQRPGGAVELAQRCSREFPGMRALVADGLPHHDAGGSDAEELGAALAAATTYLRWLTEAGLDVDTACDQVEFRLAATVDQFATIAKFRAARRLWDRVTSASGAASTAQRQHAVTSSAMLTRRDPWVNILRTTIATFAAGLGGAQAVTAQPFDAAIGLPDDFSLRVARNTQALLLEESGLAQVIDPAGGSWYVETLTDELAHAAWEWFQRIEAAGGLPAALDSGLVAERLASTWQRRREALAHRRDPVVGVSEFPNLGEQPVERDPAPEEPSGGLPRVRYAEEFEALRDAADRHEQRTGSRPQVFLATLGPLATYTARASFTRNLLAAGGIEAVEAGPTESAQEVVAAYTGSPVVCLCSSDRVYDERAAETAAALRGAGAERVLLAGKKPAGGVDDHLFDGCDALGALRDVHGRLGVQ
jgi:methylmalonyl-CoA mutase